MARTVLNSCSLTEAQTPTLSARLYDSGGPTNVLVFVHNICRQWFAALSAVALSHAARTTTMSTACAWATWFAVWSCVQPIARPHRSAANALACAGLAPGIAACVQPGCVTAWEDIRGFMRPEDLVCIGRMQSIGLDAYSLYHLVALWIAAQECKDTCATNVRRHVPAASAAACKNTDMSTLLI